jgi:Flp pilus assembly pilin Flp
MQRIRAFLMDESGQAIVEFMLLLLVVVGIVSALKTGLKKLTVKIWFLFARRIAAPCPGCDAGQNFDTPN